MSAPALLATKRTPPTSTTVYPTARTPARTASAPVRKSAPAIVVTRRTPKTSTYVTRPVRNPARTERAPDPSSVSATLDLKSILWTSIPVSPGA